MVTLAVSPGFPTMSEDQNGDNPLKEWTTVRHAAKQLGRDPSVLRYWAKKGYIQLYEIAPRVSVVKWEEVREYAEEHKPHYNKDH